MSLKFEWDETKANLNFSKHGIQFEESASTFSDPNLITEFDVAHSMEEERYISIGCSSKGRLLTTIYTVRGSSIRIISSRPCTSREARIYYDEG